MIQIFHNPRCGKSRECLRIVQETGREHEVVNYLVNPPRFEEISEIIRKLEIKPLELVRKKEKIWIEKFKNQSMTDSEIIKAMEKHPILIERPVLIEGKKALIAREVGKIKSFLKI